MVFGLKQKIIEAECPICLKPYDESSIINSRCGHIFHTACINDWKTYDKHIKGRVTCPICIEEFQEETLICKIVRLFKECNPFSGCCSRPTKI